MNESITDYAAHVAKKLDQLYKERRIVGDDGFAVLEKLDPALALLASDVWNDNVSAASEWFTGRIKSLGMKTPWQCLADGERDKVQHVLVSIAFGLGSYFS